MVLPIGRPNHIRSLLKLIGFLVCFSSPAFAGEDWQAQPIGPFSGLNNRDNSFAIPAGNAQDLLNVNITPGGKSFYKRKGYGTSYTEPVSTSATHGVYTFFDANGNTVDLYSNDTYLVSLINGLTSTTLLTTAPRNATFQFTDSLGIAYGVNSSRSSLYKTDGKTVTSLSGIVSTGTMVATCVTRLAMAGFSDRPSGIDFSADSDFTTWGFGSLGTSPVQLTVSSPGSRITHIVYAFGRLMWFKDSSFGYVLLGNQPAQTDWVIRTVSYDVGTLDNTSVYREGILYFRGQDGHIYSFDGSNYVRLSREIAGTIQQSQFKTSDSWTQTTQSDFQAGATSPAGWIDTGTVSGQMFLTTAPALSPFVDSTANDFSLASTITNVDTTTIPGSVRFNLVPQNVVNAFYPGAANTCATPCTGPYYQAQSIPNTAITGNSILSSAILRLKKTGSPGNYNVLWRSDNGGVPGTTLETVLISPGIVGTSLGDVVINFSSTTRLLSGTTYWLQLIPANSCDPSNFIEWDGTAGSGVTIPTGCGTVPTTSFLKYGYKIFTTSFTPTGNYVSRIFDMGFSTNTWIWNWSTFAATTQIPSGATLSYQTQTSSSSSGIFESFQNVSSGSSPISTKQEFIRYNALFSSAVDPSTSPVINDISLSISPLQRPAATFYSAVKNAPNLTAWDTLQVTKSDNGGINTFYIRSSTGPIGVLAGNPAWTPIISGAIPSISTGTYFQIRDDMVSSDIAHIPVLYDFTQYWFEGSAADKAYATYFDDKIWWAVNVGTLTSANNRTMVYDMLNQTWLLYDLPCNGFLVKQNRLYFGSSVDGHIYKFGDADSDAGNPINAYWKSKDFFGGSPFGTQEMTNISIAAKTVVNSTATVTYVINGSSSASFQMGMYTPNNQFIGKNKNLPGGLNCSTYNVQVGNNAIDQPFEIFGLQVGIRPKSWIPTP